jgi:prepilin peptidase CpaA
MTNPSSLALLMVGLLTAVAAVWDLRTGEIPNRLVALGAALCTSVMLATSVLGGGASLLRTLVGMVLGLLLVTLVPFLLFRAGGMGGGDVKLLAVVGVALGPMLGLEAELYAFIAAMLYAPARLIWEGKLVRALKTTALLAVRPLLPKHRRPEVAPSELTSLRFAPAIFVGTLAAAIHALGAAR